MFDRVLEDLQTLLSLEQRLLGGVLTTVQVILRHLYRLAVLVELLLRWGLILKDTSIEISPSWSNNTSSKPVLIVGQPAAYSSSVTANEMYSDRVTQSLTTGWPLVTNRNNIKYIYLSK